MDLDGHGRAGWRAAHTSRGAAPGCLSSPTVPHAAWALHYSSPSPSLLLLQVAGVQYVLDTVMQALQANPHRKFIYSEMVGALGDRPPMCLAQALAGRPLNEPRPGPAQHYITACWFIAELLHALVAAAG